MKRNVVFLIIAVISSALIIGLLVMATAFLLTNLNYTPPFRESTSKGISVELYNNLNKDAPLLLQLNEEEAKTFMSQLRQLKCRKRFSPTDEIGALEIRIYYSLDEADIIGSSANGSMEQGKLHMDGWYYYSLEDLRTLFSKYVDAALLPEAN